MNLDKRLNSCIRTTRTLEKYDDFSFLFFLKTVQRKRLLYKMDNGSGTKAFDCLFCELVRHL